MPDTTQLQPFEVEIDTEAVADLRTRLANTIWPDQIEGSGWDYGTDLGEVQELCVYWAQDFDWAGFVARANRHPQALTEIDGERIHLIHARSPESTALPLLITHGWPGSVAEFWDVIGPLADPRAHGGDPADAFHVVAPSLPGYGFSGPTRTRGVDASSIAARFGTLMDRLGYERYIAQGGDWGALVTTELGRQLPDRVAAIHLNLLACPPPPRETRFDGVTDAELADLEAAGEFKANETGYQAIQSTKPQTLAYGLSDSPAGLAAWIIEKFRTLSDCGGDVTAAVGRDRLVDNLSVYWLTRTINSSMHLYHETIGPGRTKPPSPVTVPTGHAKYPGEIYKTPRAWADQWYPIVHWAEMPRGGHFAAMEVPELFIDDLRTFARPFREAAGHYTSV